MNRTAPGTEIMTLAEAFETIFNTLQAMEAFVAAALAWEPETAEDELKQQPAQLIKLFLVSLQAACSAILERQP